MNKTVIFFEHGVETLTYFSRQLAQVFASWDYEIVWMDLNMAGLSAWKLRQTMPGKEAVLITFNFIGLSGEEEFWDYNDQGMPETSIWEKLGILCLNIMADHPIYYFKALKYPVSGMKIFCADRDHVSYMERFYPDIPCEFLPLAGNMLPERLHRESFPQEEELWEHWIMRPYSLVFTANYIPLPNIEKQLQMLEAEYRDFYYEIIDAFIRNPQQELLSCIESYLRREMPDINDVQLCEAMSTMPAVDLWIRMYFREKTVRMLAENGMKVHLFGKNWDQMPCKCPQNLIFSGHMIDSADCVRAMAQGKIALNTMPWFKDGAHDRIFTAMLQQTAAVTDDSRYLREQLQDMDTVVYYNLQNLEELPVRVQSLLEDPEQLFETACRGKAAAERSHTWKCRAEVLRRYL